MSVQRFVLVLAQLIDHGLNAQHEEFIAQMQTELKILLAGSIVEHRIDKRHQCRLEIHIVPIRIGGSIQIVDNALEAATFCGKFLKVQHRLQHLAMSTGYQTNSSQYLQC